MRPQPKFLVEISTKMFSRLRTTCPYSGFNYWSAESQDYIARVRSGYYRIDKVYRLARLKEATKRPVYLLIDGFGGRESLFSVGGGGGGIEVAIPPANIPASLIAKMKVLEIKTIVL